MMKHEKMIKTMIKNMKNPRRFRNSWVRSCHFKVVFVHLIFLFSFSLISLAISSLVLWFAPNSSHFSMIFPNLFCNLYIYINQEMTKKKHVKRIPPPNAAIPLRNPILRTSRFCQIWDLLLITWFRWDVMKYDKTWWIVCFVVFDIRINQEMTKQECKKDTSSKCSHTFAEPHT